MIPLLAAALAFVLVEMSLTYLVGRRLRNYGVVDVVWSVGFAPIALLFYMLSGQGPAQGQRIPALVLVLAVGAWALRLGGHLLARVHSHHPVEDVRYAQLRAEWGDQADSRMFGFFLLQGALQVVLSIPFAWVCLDPTPRGGPLQVGIAGCLGLALWLVGIVGESIADRQLARFRSHPGHRGQVCQEGLWRFSRHPNYFFEWLVWVGYAVFASGSEWGWTGWLSPALMLHFLLHVTGIPMTEALSLKSKGDAYRRYQETTSAFFPLPPRPQGGGIPPAV